MQRLSANRAQFVVLFGLAAYAAFALVGAGRVPFHPDETSLLFQSRDLERYLSDPGSLAWSPGSPADAEAQYRALNPPLAKYLLGLGRRMAGYPAESAAVDWDWSADWESNLARGGLPPARMLTGARLVNTVLLLVALALTYLLGRELAGHLTGALATGLLGFNALFLLHGRRAMMEAALLFGLCLALWAMLRADRKPWLAGIGVGLALSAKHSLLPLLPLGLLATLWATGPARTRLLSLAKYTAGAALVVLLLAPFLWADPPAAVAKIWQERGSLVGDQLQTQELAGYVAMQLPMSGSDRLAAFLGQVFFAPPQFAEAANYQAALAGAVEQYLRVPAHGWLRGWVAGGALFGLTLLGAVGAAVSLARQDPAGRRTISLLLLSTAGMALALLAAVPFPFQRYYLPMLPLVSLWSALGLASLGAISKRLLSKRAAAG